MNAINAGNMKIAKGVDKFIEIGTIISSAISNEGLGRGFLNLV